jgi:hypothetical protein
VTVAVNFISERTVYSPCLKLLEINVVNLNEVNMERHVSMFRAMSPL